MNPVTIKLPKSINEAVAIQNTNYNNGTHEMPPVIKAGGIDLIDHMKEGLVAVPVINNLRQVKDPVLYQISDMSIGALATLTRIANDKNINTQAPVLAQAALTTATPQIRNVATLAGNLLQRPRCWYYRNQQFECLKKDGHHCFAVEGENKYHAIFGDGPCHIVHPSNMANALSVCGGKVVTSRTENKGHSRTILIEDLFTMPDVNIRSEHILGADEIVTEIQYDNAPFSAHYEIREKQSFDWPLVMVSAAVNLDSSGIITEARICAGAVAPKPWRLTIAENTLRGTAISDTTKIRKICNKVAALGAKPMADNKYKMTLLSVAISRALEKIAQQIR